MKPALFGGSFLADAWQVISIAFSSHPNDLGRLSPVAEGWQVLHASASHKLKCKPKAMRFLHWSFACFSRSDD